MNEFRQYFKRKIYPDGFESLSIKVSKLPIKVEHDDSLPFPLRCIDDYLALVDEQRKSISMPNLYRSLARARQSIYDICMSNTFDWFVTLTFDKEKCNRLDDDVTLKMFAKWRKAFKRKHPLAWYLAVPEYHKKGGIHFHIVIGGVSADELQLVYAKSVTKDDGTSFDVFNVGAWSLGFSTATKIRYPERICGYVTKYLTKSGVDVRFYGRRRYFCSDNINRPLVDSFDLAIPNDITEYITDESISVSMDMELVYHDFDKAYRKFESKHKR